MPGSAARRNTTTRDRHRNILRRGHPPCGICHEDIDYTLPHLDPGEYVVDHVIPLAKGGSDEIENKQPAHRLCNRIKGDGTADEDPVDTEPTGPRTFITDRQW